jgi:uncharacterized protein YndB with AHSA1/START domain
VSDQIYDWSYFKRKIYIKAPLSQVFNSWAIPSKIITWFIRKANYVSSTGEIRDQNDIMQAGDTYTWYWHQDLTTKGEVISVILNKEIKFTFGNKEPRSSEKVMVTIILDENENETSFTLTQENMGDKPLNRALYHLSCNMGWSFFMTNMKALLEHGVDLREHDAERAYETRALSL